MFEKVIKYAMKFFFFIFYGKSIILHNSVIRKCSFCFSKKENKLHVYQAKILNSNFDVNGNSNRIVIKKTDNIFYGLTVNIVGNENNIFIEENATICGLRIVIRGNGCNVSIGRNFSENQNCVIVCMGENNYVKIGDDCMFSSDIDIWNTDSHRILNAAGNIVNVCLPIEIGNHVWIGKRSCILKGVTLGDNSIVGFASVVTKDVEENSVYAGNPARKIKGEINWSKEFVTS